MSCEAAKLMGNSCEPDLFLYKSISARYNLCIVTNEHDCNNILSAEP